MATPQFPALFLSHSGEQKAFVWRLYRELLHVNHSPFFDQDARDSLPKGEPFPPRIVEACRTCKLGIVVISHQYIESMWPMLELQLLLFHNPSAPQNVYPIFFGLTPTDLCKQENVARWQIAWEKQAALWNARNSGFTSVELDIESWPKALEMLRYQSGQIFPGNKQDEHPFIQAIVSNVCKRLPSPNPFFMGDHFKGAQRIQQEIHELFQQQETDEKINDSSGNMPISVGLYGVGGSGKTTVCKYMLNFYNEDWYPGSCCFLQFPTREEDESQLLIQSMKDILKTRGNLAKETLDVIKSVEQAMLHFQELLRRYSVFFILDNVCDWSLQIAKQILAMDFMPGSRLLVNARSEPLLKTLSKTMGRLPRMKIVHVPSISEEEAIEALMSYGLTSSLYISNAEDLRGLARSCFFDEQCHPLLVKAVGAKLRHLGGHTHSSQDWAQLISRIMQAIGIHSDKEIEVTVVNVLKTSYDALDFELQNTFLKLGTCIPKVPRWIHDFKSLLGSSEWLSMISDSGSHTIEDIRDQLIRLEYHGLIQIQKEDVVIHDLQMMLIEKIVRENNGAPRCFLFSGDVATLSASEWRRCRYIHGFCEKGTYLRAFSPQRRWLKHINGCFPSDQRATSPNFPDIEVLQLGEDIEAKGVDGKLRLSVQHMQSLRYLVLKRVSNLKAVVGWHGAPNLVSVKLINCRGLKKIESMTCLHRLESLVITGCFFNRKGLNDLTEFLGHILPKLRELDLSGCSNLGNVGTLSAYTSLQRCILRNTGVVNFPDINSTNLKVLDLSACERLQSMEGSVCGLTGLEELSLEGCINLERIPELNQLVKLRSLKLGGCNALKEVKVGEAVLTSLEHLSLDYGCCHFISTLSCSPLLISDFTNLRSLVAWGIIRWGTGENIDIGSWNDLPDSFEDLRLCGFIATAQLEMTGLSALLNLQQFSVIHCPSLKEVRGLSALVNLKQLLIIDCPSLTEIRGLSALVNLKQLEVRSCPSLTRITGLGTLIKLLTLRIYFCESLREVGHWEAPFTSSLKHVFIWDCPKLDTLSTMKLLPSLTSVAVSQSPIVQEGKLLEGLHKKVLHNITYFWTSSR